MQELFYQFYQFLGRFSLFDCFLCMTNCHWQCQPPETFFRMEKILFLAIQIAKIVIRTITLRMRTLIAIPRKSTLKSIFFWDKCLKLGSRVLGTKTKLSNYQNFDVGFIIENTKFCKLPVLIFEGFWATSNFQNPLFSLLRPKSKF